MSDALLADGARLHWEERAGSGSDPDSSPFIFQHGMGGEISQPLSYLEDAPHPRLICIEARGHGHSSDIDLADASFDRFADDVVEVADQIGLDRFAIGGISLGAGTALNLALRHPDRISALVLCRPAWLAKPQAAVNRQTYEQIADLLDQDGAEAGLESFRTTERYQEVQAGSTAAAASLVGQFTRSGAVRNSLVLRAFPADRPARTLERCAEIAVPTLVVGHRDDPFHPYSMAEAYAAAVPGARLVTVPSKDADPHAFRIGIRSAITDFLGSSAALLDR